MRRSVVLGVGSALPNRRVTNDELASEVDTSDEWIVARTGIRSRYVAGEGETTASLAVEAGRRALDHAGANASDIDLIILATATPDQTFPSSATKVQATLGIPDCIAFDVHAVCTGFLYALTTADAMLRGGNAKTALVIGAETFSRILDWEDRTTCVLFGDGAGAIVLRAEETDDRGILATRLHADGKWGEVGRALIVLRPGHAAAEAEIIAFCRGRLAGYKVPKSVRFVAELPRNSSGKILKPELRKRYGS